MKTSSFYGRLESLRGLAALSVIFYHALSVFRVPGIYGEPPQTFSSYEKVQGQIIPILFCLFNGPAAVTLFFVLSGFVLCLASDRMYEQFPFFWIRRGLRILPAYGVSLLLMYGFLKLVYHPQLFPQASEWFNKHSTRPTSLMDVFDHLLFRAHLLNPPTWTQKIEWFASLLFPFLAILFHFRKPFIDLGILIFLLWVSYHLLDVPYLNDQNVIVFKFLYLFWLGCLVVRWKKWILLGQNKFVSLALAMGALLMFLISRSALPPSEFIVTLVEGISSAILIAALVTFPQAKICAFLDGRACRFLGRVSYSVYLLHFMILYFCATLLMRWVPEKLWLLYPLPFWALLAGMVFSLTLPLAAVSFWYVEAPCIEWGKKFLKRQKRSYPICEN